MKPDRESRTIDLSKIEAMIISLRGAASYIEGGEELERAHTHVYTVINKLEDLCAVKCPLCGSLNTYMHGFYWKCHACEAGAKPMMSKELLEVASIVAYPVSQPIERCAICGEEHLVDRCPKKGPFEDDVDHPKA